ncbi:MAG: phospholipase D-like domain-containing protein [Chloroflexota bacterium]|nr:phospholipase D-like domain-containing protein [Chloroflexota bacterium]
MPKRSDCPMQSFDLDALLRYTPPEYVCERCCALLTGIPDGFAYRCPVCGVTYVPTDEYPTVGQYLSGRGLKLTHPDPILHGQRLALVARKAKASLAGQTMDYSPMRGLLEALNTAQHCVHFTTFGISAFLLGVIKMAAQRVAIRGIISGIKRDEMYRELTTYADDAPHLQTRVFTQDSQWFPHQKLLIVDGLIAFKGSANLTDIGWRKAAQGREVIEVITDMREVVELNNRFFSPVWAGFERSQAQSEQIYMSAAGR